METGNAVEFFGCALAATTPKRKIKFLFYHAAICKVIWIHSFEVNCFVCVNHSAVCYQQFGG
ncbi:hypothetical protein A9978_22020 [Pseudomonas sp. UMC65]|nr:hypothetical protein BME99_28670 [Pseudomonas protegens]MBB1615120.1 hypothetical protein [Pseudomonas sp. UMC65]MBB1621139.1 hypothetical protein [Pseudomonas sp. UME65]ROM32266.1 hypothetical protein BK644_03480 [Pseudomonas protegens]